MSKNLYIQGAIAPYLLFLVNQDFLINYIIPYPYPEDIGSWHVSIERHFHCARIHHTYGDSIYESACRIVEVQTHVCGGWNGEFEESVARYEMDAGSGFFWGIDGRQVVGQCCNYDVPSSPYIIEDGVAEEVRVIHGFGVSGYVNQA